MGTVYLHIGTPKTGTSAIQVFMGKNRGMLTKKGFCYPDFGMYFEGIGRNRNAHFLVQRCFTTDKKRAFQKEEEIQEKAFSHLFKKLEQYENVVMSDEGIWNGFEYFDDFWTKLQDKITSAGHTLKVIVYLRRQDSFIQSYWAQQVKETSTDSFQQFMEKKKYEKCHLDYAGSLKQIAQVVGSENVIVRVYEKEQYYGGSLIADFLHLLGLELTEEFLDSKEIVNQSIDGKSLELKRIWNEMPEFKEKKGFIVDYLRELSGNEKEDSGFFHAACFLPGQQQEFLEQYRAGNEQVARTFLQRKDGTLFTENVENKEGVTEEYSKEDLVLACGEIIVSLHNKLKKEKDKNAFFKRIVKKIKGLRR